MTRRIPLAVVAAVSEVISRDLTGTRIDHLFASLDIESPANTGNSKYEKVRSYLSEIDSDSSADPLAVLGRVIEELMDRDIIPDPFGSDPLTESTLLEQWRTSLRSALAKHGLHYITGGSIVTAGVAAPTDEVKNFMRDRSLASLDDSFHRIVRNVNDDPPAALDAACSLVESFCKHYIEEHQHLDMPPKLSISPLWKVVQTDLGLDPAQQSDEDIKRILSGLTSVVHGLGSFRTHAGAAHGRGARPYRARPRHARLVLHAAHTLVHFALETWMEREGEKP